jgi:phosphoglycerol transferase MdoB-like AlkP superfamily enzyme
VAVLFFGIFRLVLFLTESARITADVSSTDIFKAFFMGLRFDVVIAGYILVLPFFLWAMSDFLKISTLKLARFLQRFVGAAFATAFIVCAVDIPYFNHFFARLSITVFEWFDSPAFVLKMVFQEPLYWLIAIPLLAVLLLFWKWNRRIFQGLVPTTEKYDLKNGLLSLVFLALMFLGIRGRIEEKSPIRIGTAYFCNNAFLNQLGLNPNFTLIRSYLDSQKLENVQVNLMEEQSALNLVQKQFNVSPGVSSSPLSRQITFDSSASTPHNVVLVIMESMSAAKMSRHGNNHRLTPFLDSLSNEGIYFENAYTSGIHTFNGIFSTLFGFPALFRQHPMKESGAHKFGGIFSALKPHNYSTVYFTTHDGQFDNVEGFLRSNDCERIVSKPDYPSEKVKTTLGVPDDYMFEFAMPRLNELHARNKPFFAAFMTASDHGPYYIPEYFKPRNTETKQQIVEYADFSLKKLLEMAAQQPWFNNTLFVFVADHGASMDGLYDMSLTYNHSPLLFYSPDILKAKRVESKIAGQIDVFPSIMGILRLPYQNNTLGIDLFRENRPYIYFNADDKYGVLNDNWFLIVRNDRSKSLYQYSKKDTQNQADAFPAMVEEMDTYAKSNLQTFQYVIKQAAKPEVILPLKK